MNTAPWAPSASLDNLRTRARLLAAIRRFFAERGVLEVETPLLSQAATTDPHLESFVTAFHEPGAQQTQPCYLHTSPEFAMKRLLAAGSGPIYQLCKVFRQGERGRRHNPEFTMLEWYRPQWDHHALMDEVEALIRAVLPEGNALGPTERLSYVEALRRHAGIDPLEASIDQLAKCAQGHGITLASAMEQRDDWLDLLMSHVVEPRLGKTGLCFIHDYPRSQAALARISPEDSRLAQRFELYYRGVELANGFHELTDAAEQRARFEADLERRRTLGLDVVPMDERLLAALEAGLTSCAGVALGVDRLCMLLCAAERIDEVISFTFERS
ncbi:MAG: EF-P lysine aminoacylase EpmA [Pseudomonadota bacterium]